MTILLPKSQMCSKIACHIPDKAAILLIATHHTCCRLGSRNLERETRERDALAHGEKEHVPCMLLLTV